MSDFEKYKQVIRNIASKYAIGHPNNREEIYSAACCGFCELRFKESDTDNVKMMKVIQKCRESCRDFIAQDRVLIMSRDTFYSRLSSSHLPDRELLHDVFTAKVDCDYLVLELIEDLKLTPRERVVVDMLVAGYDLDEVAYAVGIKLNRLLQIRHDIEGKILCL